jgi:acetyltransferase-like isoleucine patch superfamily enzyme
VALVSIAILGAGPHGQQIADLHPGWTLLDDLLAGYKKCEEGAQRSPYVIGAAMPKVRRAIEDKLAGLQFRADVHNHGNIIFPGVQIGRQVELGEHVHVLYNAVVSHGCQVGDFVTICSGAVLAGEVTVEHGAFIGANATIRHGGITIGRNAIVGMGAVVVDDVPDNTKVVGNPAKVLLTL